MIAGPVYPFPRALGFRESRKSSAAAVASQSLFRGRLVPERRCRCRLCLCTLCFLRQILGMRVNSDWMRAGRVRHRGGGIRKQMELGWRLMGGQGR